MKTFLAQALITAMACASLAAADPSIWDKIRSGLNTAGNAITNTAKQVGSKTVQALSPALHTRSEEEDDDFDVVDLDADEDAEEPEEDSIIVTPTVYRHRSRR